MTQPAEHTRPNEKGGTKDIYNETYFQGGREKSNYDNYVEQSRGPCTILGQSLFEFFRPASSLDMGCAVGHTVKKLRELGCEAYGTDISSWAVSYAAAPYIIEFDAAHDVITRSFELVHSYDVVEHIPPERLEFAARNLWRATKKDMLVVPATYEHGETFDPNEPTHLTFWSREQWISFFTQRIGCRFDEAATARFESLEHTQIFNYTNRIMIFSKINAPNTTCEI